MAEETSGVSADGPRALLTQIAGPRRTLPELQDELFLDVGDASRKLSRFWVLLALAATIATAGILTESTATVIGAMIVAPLGTPIMGIGLAVVIGDARRLTRSAALVLGGAVAVVLLAALLAWILPRAAPPRLERQVTSRTSPGVIDLIAAVATGFAGAYGLARKDVSDVMPGVAIAISLVPPLAVVGITAVAGEWGSAWGAFLLFASNVVAMVVAGTVLLTLYGYHREAGRAPGFRRRPAYAVVAASLVLILVPLGLTTSQAAREQLWLRRASAVAGAWATGRGYVLQDVSFEGPDLHVMIEGYGPVPQSSQLLDQLRGQLPPGTPVVVDTISGGSVLIGRVPAVIIRDG
jgi:uncharacterized hydrophobic protein (TIGR00271 family)